jgi:branched-chain amino acid aminotransferase
MAAKQYVWFNGKFVEFGKANVHVLTHSLQYGSGIFEGLRAHSTARGAAIFRLRDHCRRFVNSAKVYNMKIGLSVDDVSNAVISIVTKNKLGACYIRPFAFYDDNRIGINPIGRKVSTVIAAVPFGNYFEGKDRGISCKVSSWHRINSLILPPQAKASGNYLNSIIASLEAVEAGANEAILLTEDGYVAEGPGENIFLVRDNVLITPSIESDILLGITRDTVIKLAEGLGIEVEERSVHREELYTSSEVFFTGTAAEVTPIVRVDSRSVGNGKPGPITKLLNDKYIKVVTGEIKEYEDWLTYVR